MHYKLVCTTCGARYGDKESIFKCRKCNGVLEVVYAYEKINTKKLRKEKVSFQKYSQLYPAQGKLISSVEGGTELKKATKHESIAKRGTDLYFKIETENLSRSFKDRGTVIEISKAKELGFREVCCASTGNMGLSVAMFARKNGLKCTIFISKDANRKKIEKIRKQGAKIIEIDGDYNRAATLAERFSIKKRLFLCGDYHYRKEGQKSIAFEIIDQLHFKTPDYLFMQVGAGTFFASVYKGLLEFKRLKLIKKLPKLVAVQSQECNPLVRAYNSKAEIRYTKPRTYADAINVGYPTFGYECIAALHETHGLAISVPDKEIENARKHLKKTEGISSEPGGAAGFAGFLYMYNKNPNMFKNKSVVLVVSGNNED